MSEFSVKKPLTIFCAAIAILVLGVIAYTRMTPDLLPNMDFPYVIIMTTAPGASPETVEETISKPMEQSMATLDHIKNITSSSSDNYSMVMLEFEDDVNLDTIGVDIQQKISTLQSGWDDTVGTPYVMKINPSMIPVEVAAVSMEGMDVIQLSEFAENELIPKLEGVSGVARITSTGLVDQELHVVISQEKIDAMNEKIADAINEKMDQAEAQLNAAKAQMTNALAGLQNSAANSLRPADETSNPLTQEEAQEQIQETVSQLETGKETLENAIDTLTAMQDALNTSDEAAEESAEQAAQRQRLEQEIAQLDEQLEPYQQKIREINDSDSTTEEKAQALRKITEDETYRNLMGDRAARQVELATLGLESQTPEQADLRTALEGLGLDVDQVDATLTQLLNSLRTLQKNIDALNNLSQALRDQAVSLAEASQRYQQITQGMSDFSLSTDDLIDGVTSMAMAMLQIEQGLNSIESGREDALNQADLNNILTLQTVSQILAAQNFSMPAGYVEQDGINYMVSVGDEFTSEEQLGDLLLFDFGMEGLDPVYLRDVANVFITDNSASIYAKLNRENGVILSFEKQSNYATAAVSENIEKRFGQLQEEYEGLSFRPLMDQGDYIALVVNSILQSLLFGALFSILVLFVFLRDIRPTVITLCSIPLSVVFAIVLMYFSGVTLNIISLSGLSIAVGMLVDNSVVVIENIYRLRAKGANAIQASVSGAKQVAGAITASTLTTICVFLPIVFVDGITKDLFTDLALTLGYALMASLIIALTLVPAMASGLLKKDGARKRDIMDHIYDKYRFAGQWALDHKAAVFLLSIGLLIGSAALCLSKGFTFMPEVDGNTISGSISFDETTEFADAVDISDQVLARIDQIEEVDTVGAMMGSSSSASGGISVTLYVTLPEGISGKEIGNQIIDLCRDLPCNVSCSSSMMDMSMLTGSGISIDLFGNNMEQLQESAKTVAGVLGTVEGTGEVSDGLEDAATALHVTIDRNKAMAKGYTVAQVYMQLAGNLSTNATATSFTLDGAGIDVIVETPEESHVTVSNLEDQEFTQTDAEGNASVFHLSDIASVEETVSMNTIKRDNQRRYLSVSATVAEGYNVTKVTAAAQKALADAELPDGVTVEFSGENESIMEAMQQLVLMLLLGMLLVYFVMVAQFQSLKSPFIVMFTIPLAFTGGFLGLLLTGMEVSIVSMIGFVMLTGIIVNNGIVLVDYINQLRLEGMERREAILEAGVTRIRPILMTSLTTVLGLLVMALGRDAGTALMQPMAVVCIGGLLYATLMTLFVVPCIYDLMNRNELRKVEEADLVILTD